MAEQERTLPNGDVVIMDDTRRTRVFYLQDIYKYRILDGSGEIITTGGQYIPNVNDRIFDYTLGEFRANTVDTTTFVTGLSEWTNKQDDPEVTDEDRFLSTGTGYQSESWRIYLDTRTTPYRLNVDEGFRVYGSNSAFVRIYRGVDTSENGEIVSAFFNQQGEYAGDRIPLEIVANVTDSTFGPNAELENVAIKAPMMGYTTKQLREGEYLTLVAYSTDGTPIRSGRFICHRTNVYGRVEDTQKRVTSIQLVSPYLSETEPNKLLVPLNINVASITLRARVNYSDGSSILSDVGDENSSAKFKIFGLKYWSPSIAGTPKRLTLMYRLSPSEEYSRSESESENGLVKEDYEIVATEIDPSLSLKLFVFPSWSNGTNSYTLDFWLFDLLRAQYYRVPSTAIEYDQHSPVFNGQDFLTVQSLTVAVKLRELDVIWGNHRHVQTLQIALLGSGGVPGTKWRVRHSSNQAAWYGDSKEITSRVGIGQNRYYNVSSGYTDFNTWLNDVFYAQEPLFDTQAEAKAPAPTHFVIHTHTRMFDFPISMWNGDLVVVTDLLDAQAATLRFVRRDSNGELQLGVAAMAVKSI